MLGRATDLPDKNILRLESARYASSQRAADMACLHGCSRSIGSRYLLRTGLWNSQVEILTLGTSTVNVEPQLAEKVPPARATQERQGRNKHYYKPSSFG